MSFKLNDIEVKCLEHESSRAEFQRSSAVHSQAKLIQKRMKNNFMSRAKTAQVSLMMKIESRITFKSKEQFSENVHSLKMARFEALTRLRIS